MIKGLFETHIGVRDLEHAMAFYEDVIGLDASDVGAAGRRVQMEALYQPDATVETEFIEGDTAEEKAAALVGRLRDEKIL